MMIIMDIEYLEVEDRETIYMEMRDPELGYGAEFLHDDLPININACSEAIHGHRIIRHDGTEILVGYSQKAGEILQISNDAINELHEQVERLSNQAYKSQRNFEDQRIQCTDHVTRWNKTQAASIWTRIKWLFTGVS